MYPDRVIAIRGPVDGMAQAEAAISAKLSECLEYEIQQANMVRLCLPENLLLSFRSATTSLSQIRECN